MALFADGVEELDLERHVKAMVAVSREAGYDVEAHLFPSSALENPEPGSFAKYILDHGVRVEFESGDEEPPK